MLLLIRIGWAGRAGADFLTHVDAARPLFWPIYNPPYYGREFVAVEHGAMLAIMLALLVKRLRARKKRSLSKEDPAGARD